jgi:hypothetical protein
MRRLGIVPLLLGALVVGACGSTSTSSSAAPTPTPTPASKTPTGPPSAQLTLVGTGGLAGAMTIGDINCAQPALDGLSIVVNGNASAPGVAVRVTIQAGTASVLADAGSGAQFTSREFSGPGVTAFDATRGAQVNATLTEAASSPGQATGTLGTVTSVSGTVACNNQQPGTSTVTFTGSTANGALTGGISPVQVRCNPADGSALTLGVTIVGTTQAFVDMYGGTGQVSLLLVPRGSSTAQHFTASGASVTTLSSSGVHFNVDVVEDAAAGATPHKVHISGDVTCGSSRTP